jgi:uncharacterized protein YkwD
VLRHILALISCCALLGALTTPLATAAPVPAVPCADTTLAPAPQVLDRVAAATLCLLNNERTHRGLRPLRTNRTLERAAISYSRKMVDEVFFGHVTPSGATFLQRARASHYLDRPGGWSVGENLAWGTGDLGSPARTVAAWMHSPGHRHNILNRSFAEIGIGIVMGIPVRMTNHAPGATYTTEFGRRTARAARR